MGALLAWLEREQRDVIAFLLHACAERFVRSIKEECLRKLREAVGKIGCGVRWRERATRVNSMMI